MTFIITAASESCVIQVADTLLSRNGRPFDDRLVKTTIVHCQNGKLAISYTGLAVLDRTRTDLWLTRALTALPAWERIFPQVVEDLTARLTDAISRNPLLRAPDGGLTVVIAGRALRDNGVLWPAIAEISNNQEPWPERREFRSVTARSPFQRFFMNLEPNFRTFISISGAMDRRFEGNSMRRKIQKVLPGARTTEQQMAVVRMMVAMLRKHREKGPLSSMIGANCTAAIIQADLNSKSLFYGTQPRPLCRLPNIVRKEATREDIVLPWPSDGSPTEPEL